MAVQNVNLGKHGSFKVHKGALHNALGIPEGNKISAGRLKSAANSPNPHVRRMAASAEGFKGMRKSGKNAGKKPSTTGGYGGKVFQE